MLAPASGTQTHEEHWVAADIARFSKTNKEQNQTGRGNPRPETLLNRKYWGLCLTFYRILCGLILNIFFLYVGLVLTLHKVLNALNKTGRYTLLLAKQAK